MSRGDMLMIILIAWMATGTSSTKLYHLLDMDSSYDIPLRDNYASIDVYDSEDDVKFWRLEDDLAKNRKDHDNVAPLGFFTKRRQNLYPNVEIGPGAFKTELIQYPPDTLKKQLLNLMRIKKKLEDERKLVP